MAKIIIHEWPFSIAMSAMLYSHSQWASLVPVPAAVSRARCKGELSSSQPSLPTSSASCRDNRRNPDHSGPKKTIQQNKGPNVADSSSESFGMLISQWGWITCPFIILDCFSIIYPFPLVQIIQSEPGKRES